MDDTQARWWTARLYSQLMLRNRRTEKFERYYSGDFDTPWLPAEAQDDFKRIVHMTRSNYMALVIEAMVERMNLIGFRREGAEGDDKDLWAIWKANRISTQHNKGLLEAAIQPHRDAAHAWRRIDTSLEEVFIHLMQGARRP